MKTNGEWKDYRLIATGGGKKLEKFGRVVLLRPDPQIIWPPVSDLLKYPGITAEYVRNRNGGGKWRENSPLPAEFTVGWRDLVFKLKPMGFKHVGIFPEQAVNWARMADCIKRAGRPIKVLNLFAYTGGATAACVDAGAFVCHVDAAKGMREIAKCNIDDNRLDRSKVRFIVDDCFKFVEREIRRGNEYDAVIMDPPAYGRGPEGELWKIEDGIFDLAASAAGVLSGNPLFFLINSYTTGLQPTVMKNIIDIVLRGVPHFTDAYEIGIDGEDGITLPCGCSAFALIGSARKPVR